MRHHLRPAFAAFAVIAIMPAAHGWGVRAPKIRGHLAVSATRIDYPHGRAVNTKYETSAVEELAWAPNGDAFSCHMIYALRDGGITSRELTICDVTRNGGPVHEPPRDGSWTECDTRRESWSSDGQYILFNATHPPIGVGHPSGHLVARWPDTMLRQMLSDVTGTRVPDGDAGREYAVHVSGWHPFRHQFLISIDGRERLPSGVWLARLDTDASGKPLEHIEGLGARQEMQWSPSGDFIALAEEAASAAAPISLLELRTRRSWDIGPGRLIGWVDDDSLLVEDLTGEHRRIIDGETGNPCGRHYHGEEIALTLHGAVMAREAPQLPPRTELWWVHHTTRRESLITTVPALDQRTPEEAARVDGITHLTSTSDGRYLAYTMVLQTPPVPLNPLVPDSPTLPGIPAITTEVYDTWTGEREQIVFPDANVPSLSWSPRKHRLLHYWSPTSVYIIQYP